MVSNLVENTPRALAEVGNNIAQMQNIELLTLKVKNRPRIDADVINDRLYDVVENTLLKISLHLPL